MPQVNYNAQLSLSRKDFRLKQGFSYVADQEKRTLTSVKQVKNGDTIYISVTDGTIEAKVNSIKKEERIHVQG